MTRVPPSDPVQGAEACGLVDVEALSRTARLWAELGDALAAIGRRVGRLSEQIGHDWPDGRGREWVERVGQLGAELGREAGAAAELGAAYTRQAAVPLLPGALPPRHPAGPRLAGTEGQRADSELGFRIAQLPADGPEPG